MRYTQYKDFYNQATTLPIKGLRGQKVDMKMVFTVIVMFVITAIVISILFPGNKKIFGIEKIWVIIGSTFILYYLSSKVDTSNYPFFLYIFSIVIFAVKKIRKKAIVCFQTVDRPGKKKKYQWRFRYRDITDTGTNLLYHLTPIIGYIKSPKGLSFEFTGATRIRYNPWTKKMKIETGQFEKIQAQTKPISKYRSLMMEVGRGKLNFVVQKGKTVAQYKPITGRSDS